jgi:hypothetical protein
MPKLNFTKEVAELFLKEMAPTVYDALALTGKDKQKYLHALDVVYGPKSERALKNFDIDINRLRGAEEKANDARSNLKFQIKEETATSVKPHRSSSGLDEVPLNDDEYIVEGNIYWDGQLVESVDERLGGFASEGEPFKRVNVFDKKTGKQVASVPFEVQDDKIIIADKHFSEAAGKDPMKQAWTYVAPEARGKGVASATYSGLENKFGLPMSPSPTQTVAGEALWNKAPDLREVQYAIHSARKTKYNVQDQLENAQHILDRVRLEDPNSERIAS